MAALNSPMLRTPDAVFFSPSPRRRGPVLLSCHNKGDTPQRLRDNDDAAERRRMRITKATSNALSPATPRSASRLDSERSTVRRTGLTDLQMKDVYSNCIKLSSENKINSKNAFGLHLIDYMQDLIKTLKEGEMTNFQVASCTLDASAKIYAGRVDSIHAQAYKMLGGLGRADENADQGDQGLEDDGENQRATRAKKKAANYKPGNTIEKNIKNINVNQFDLEFEVDPLFQKTSAAFDEGGSSGLLLNHLFVRDDSCELLLDSSVALTTRDVATSSQTTQDNAMVDLSEFRDMFNRVDFEAAMVCPHFADFEFTKWNKDGEVDTIDGGLSPTAGSNEHAFDIDAPPSETACEYPEHVGGDYSDDDVPDMGGDMEFRDGCYQQGPAVNTHLAFADGPTAGIMSSQGIQATNVDSVATAIGNLCLELSEQPSEYSYYKSACSHLATWAGPEHWKRRNAFPKGPGMTSAAGEAQAKKKRAKKQVVKVDFDGEHHFAELSKRGKVSNTLAKSTLQKLSSVNTTLPEDCPCNFAGYDRFFVKRKMMVKRLLQERTGAADGEEGSDWYNYNNADDCANFCPRLQDRDDDDDDDGDVGGPAENTAGPDVTYDLSSQGSFGYESIMDQTMFTGEGLVAQPNKVQKININYAKTAKKMDVKKLKAAIWDILTVDEEEDKENIPSEQSKNDKSPTTFTVPKSFKELYSQLPNNVSKYMAKNLSVPIAFVCVLHLANEKCLKLVGNSEMSDFTITQGI